MTSLKNQKKKDILTPFLISARQCTKWRIRRRDGDRHGSRRILGKHAALRCIRSHQRARREQQRAHNYSVFEALRRFGFWWRFGFDIGEWCIVCRRSIDGLFVCFPDDDSDRSHSKQADSSNSKQTNTEKDVENCFGFDVGELWRCFIRFQVIF